MTGRLYLAGGTAIGVYLGAVSTLRTQCTTVMRAARRHPPPTRRRLVRALQVGLDVYRASGEERGLRATIAAEQHEAASCERAAEREETAVASFQEAVEQQQQAVASLDAQISELQALREAKLKVSAIRAPRERRLHLLASLSCKRWVAPK